MSKRKQIGKVKLQTGIDASFLAATLTADIELTDAIFDLIDNSIDSARNAITSGAFAKDKYGLPANYAGYSIKIRLGSNSISILDNCTGFNEESLAKNTLYVGERSNHLYGIGHYGLGLKRALLKSGSKFGMVTDNGNTMYRLIFDRNSFSGNHKLQPEATSFASEGKNRTLLTVSDLHRSVKDQINDDLWFNEIANEICVRYSIFIEKGLEISLVKATRNQRITKKATSLIPSLRSSGPIKPFSSEINGEDLKTYIEVGVHRDYRFSGERDHSTTENKKLTQSFGIYYICNDRVIVSHSKDTKYGFSASWHSEHNGFLCLVRMIGETPQSLPWNTTKTELRVHSPAFIRIRNKVDPMALEYRSKAKKIIEAWGETDKKGLSIQERRDNFEVRLNLKATGKSSEDSTGKELLKNIKTHAEEADVKLKNTDKRKSAEKNKSKHTTHWKTVLPSHFPISSTDSTLDNMIIEASQLNIESAPHASCLLYRSIFEASLKRFVRKNNYSSKVIEHFYTKGEGKRKDHDENYKMEQPLSLSMILHWLADNKSIFPKTDMNKLNAGVKNIKSKLPKINGVVHCNNVISEVEFITIRNETIILLEYLCS